jgi:TRAP-type C4-dicarboxylate transport system permease small subunit
MCATFFLMCMTTIHAVFRKFTSFGGITDSLGITELTMVLIVFCSLAYMESERGHVRVDILVNKFPKRFVSILTGILYLLTAAFIFVLFYAVAGNVGTIMSRGAATQILHIPFWPFYAVICVGLFAYALTVLFHAIEEFGKKPDLHKAITEEVAEVDLSTQM